MATQDKPHSPLIGRNRSNRTCMEPDRVLDVGQEPRGLSRSNSFKTQTLQLLASPAAGPQMPAFSGSFTTKSFTGQPISKWAAAWTRCPAQCGEVIGIALCVGRDFFFFVGLRPEQVSCRPEPAAPSHRHAMIKKMRQEEGNRLFEIIC
ncbi:unnamed protein product [Nyctereutes procyonoides]|uniref:(raccoon dog) hypothetical protein n=1 Tax=Nyctereutes procyonoides TaxID=34880 RepID=A0A811ZJW9_NYCPR|nr:unnamed protein product [Nyctereutes procyonoides]